jgi:arsenate reductase
MSEPLPKRDVVLFLCVQNSARSQMAEAIARGLAPVGVVAMSAGSNPAGVHPRALEALRESGIDAASQRSKSVAEIPVERIRVVVTLCAEEVCPAFPGDVVRIHWPLPDPASAPPEGIRPSFRAVRDELTGRIRALFGRPDLFPAPPSRPPGP